MRKKSMRLVIPILVFVARSFAADEAYVPEADLARSLGSAVRRWNGVYTPSISTGAITIDVADIATKADLNLKADITTVNEKADTTALMTEVAIRQQMDNDLQGSINAEASSRQTGDGGLQTQIDNLNASFQGMANKPARLPANSFSFDEFSSDSDELAAQQEELTNYAIETLGLTTAESIPNLIAVHNLNGNHLFIFNQSYLPEDVNYLGAYADPAELADIPDAAAGNWAYVESTATRWNYDGDTWTDSEVNPYIPAGWVDNGLDSVQEASTAVMGVVQYATNAEMEEGTRTDRVASVAQIATAMTSIGGMSITQHPIVGDGVETSWVIEHNKNTRKVIVQAFRADTWEQIILGVQITDLDTVTLTTANPLSAGYQVVVNMLIQ